MDLRLKLDSKLNFGMYEGLTVAEVMGEPKGFDYLFWVLNNLDYVQFTYETENYIRKTVELRARDRKLNPHNYLYEKTLAQLKAIALAIEAIPTDGKNKRHYIAAIKGKIKQDNIKNF